MFVAGTPIFLSIMKITVVNSVGSEWIVDVLPDFTIDKLKMMALSHFLNPMDTSKCSSQYKLIHINHCRPLVDGNTVRDENLSENDVILLLKRHLPLPSSRDDLDEKVSPTESAILQATCDITPQNFGRLIHTSPVVVDFHKELRKILISLVEESEKLVRYHPEIIEIFKEAPAKENISKELPGDPVIQQFVDMGFSKDKVISALTRMSLNEAMEWLLTNSSDENSSNTMSSLDKEDLSAPGPSHQAHATSSSVPAMLECFKSYKRKIFQPNKKALSNLKEMGFSEADVIDALRVHRNNQETACEWLLNERKPVVTENEKGLDPDGPIYKAIMSNPSVLLGLNNPKTLLALLHMLESTNTSNKWINDPDTAPILSQIFHIYHAEKHALQHARPFM